MVKEKVLIFDYHKVLFPFTPEAESTLEELKRRGYRLGSLSSLNAPKFDAVTEHYKIDLPFSAKKLKVSKNESAVYQTYCEKYDLFAEDCVLIDDNTEYLFLAKELGWQTVLFRSGDQPEYVDYQIDKIEELLNIEF